MIEWFIKHYPDYVNKMKNCSYHYSSENINQHHLEGDVWSNALIAHEYATLNNASIYVQWALLLHDIGRILTRTEYEDEKSVKFDYYEGVSCFLSLEILNKTDLSESQKDRILKIISYQYSIIDYIRYDKPSKEELLNTFKYEEQTLLDLSQYIKCDVSSRMVSKELSQYYSSDKADSFIKSISNLEVTHKPKSNKKNNLIILVGPPCSRKSTWIKNQITPSFVISRDTCTEQIGKKHGKNTYNSAYALMKENKSVKEEVDNMYNDLISFSKNSINMNIIIDNPNLQISNRKKWIKMFKKTHNIKVVLLLNSYKNILNCNKARLMSKDKSISEKGIKNKLVTFTYPLLSEGFDEIESVYY